MIRNYRNLLTSNELTQIHYQCAMCYYKISKYEPHTLDYLWALKKAIPLFNYVKQCPGELSELAEYYIDKINTSISYHIMTQYVKHHTHYMKKDNETLEIIVKVSFSKFELLK